MSTTTSNELSEAVKLMIQSGMIPPNAVQQLVNWRLLPEDFVQSIEKLPVTLESKWEAVEKFIGALRGALSNEMKTIRETEFDHAGGFRDARLYFNGKMGKGTLEKVFVDRLGRVITPAEKKYQKLSGVRLVGGPLRAVVNQESRFEGSQEVAYVHYLDKEEADASN